MDADVKKRIVYASRVFGALRKAVSLERKLRLKAKRRIYQVCILSVPLYGAECWIPLNSYHRCIRTILGITNLQQWTEHITMCKFRSR